MHKNGATEEDAAYVAVRDRKHGLNNPYAQLRTDMNIEDVMGSPYLAWPVKLRDMCPRTDGACAVVFASEKYAEKICDRPAWIHGVSVKHPYNYLGDYDWDRPAAVDADGLQGALREGRDQGAPQGDRRDGALSSVLVRRGSPG